MTPTVEIIDLSHHNTIPQDLTAAKEAGVLGVIHKLTEGNSFVDEKAAARNFLANEAGLLWGVYHFLRPGDMGAQVDFFLRTAHELDVLDARALVCIDYEDPAVSLADLHEALATLRSLSGRAPVLYAGGALKDKGGAEAMPELRAFRLWLAQYAAEPELPAGFDHFWAWQFTKEGTIAGVNSPVDLNHYAKAPARLRFDWANPEMPC